MNDNDKKYAKSLVEKYNEKEISQVNELRKLDAKAQLPANIFTFTFGTIGALVLGVGMCLAMEVIGSSIPLGIVIGVIGIIMVSVNYFIYKAILKKSTAKYSKLIIEKSTAILNQ